MSRKKALEQLRKQQREREKVRDGGGKEVEIMTEISTPTITLY